MPDSLSVVDPTMQPELTIRLGDSMVSSAADTLAPSSVPMQSLPMLSVDLRDALTDEAGPSSGVRPDLEVRGALGEGGMGRVLLARQHSLSRDVAWGFSRRLVWSVASSTGMAIYRSRSRSSLRCGWCLRHSSVRRIECRARAW